MFRVVLIGFLLAIGWLLGGNVYSWCKNLITRIVDERRHKDGAN